MSEVKWTNEQLNAITKKDSNILVAAAFVNVTTKILSISTLSSIIFLIIRSTNTAVFPLPCSSCY